VFFLIDFQMWILNSTKKETGIYHMRTLKRFVLPPESSGARWRRGPERWANKESSIDYLFIWKWIQKQM